MIYFKIGKMVVHHVSKWYNFVNLNDPSIFYRSLIAILGNLNEWHRWKWTFPTRYLRSEESLGNERRGLFPRLTASIIVIKLPHCFFLLCSFTVAPVFTTCFASRDILVLDPLIKSFWVKFSGLENKEEVLTFSGLGHRSISSFSMDVARFKEKI